MDTELLKHSVNILKEIRAELHDNVENSVIEQLDKVIQDIEAFLKGKAHRVTGAFEILILLGTLIEKVPEIANVIEYLTQLIKSTPTH